MATPRGSLEERRAEFASSRFLAMPIAGTIAWPVIGVAVPAVILVIYLVTIYVLLARAQLRPYSLSARSRTHYVLLDLFQRRHS